MIKNTNKTAVIKPQKDTIQLKQVKNTRKQKRTADGAVHEVS